MTDNEDALVPAVEQLPENMARLTITYNGQQGDLPDAVTYDSTDADLKQGATEAVRAGDIPGIDAAPEADFTDFIVDRYSANAGVPYARLSLRPKTPFGAGPDPDAEKKKWWSKYLSPLIEGTIVEVGTKTDHGAIPKEHWPYIKVQTKNGEAFTLEVSRDPEGNGPRFLLGLPRVA